MATKKLIAKTPEPIEINISTTSKISIPGEAIESVIKNALLSYVKDHLGIDIEDKEPMIVIHTHEYLDYPTLKDSQWTLTYSENEIRYGN